MAQACAAGRRVFLTRALAFATRLLALAAGLWLSLAQARVTQALRCAVLPLEAQAAYCIALALLLASTSVIEACAALNAGRVGFDAGEIEAVWADEVVYGLGFGLRFWRNLLSQFCVNFELV